MTNKRSSEILADENRKIFGEKVNWGNSPRVRKCFRKQGEKSETGWKCIIDSRAWTPLEIMISVQCYRVLIPFRKGRDLILLNHRFERLLLPCKSLGTKTYLNV